MGVFRGDSGYGLEVVRDYSLTAVERGKVKGQGDPFITSICLPDFEYGDYIVD